MPNKTTIKRAARIRRKQHIRKKVQGTADKPRLVVFRSAKHIYAQLIDDDAGNTLVAYTSNSKDAKEKLKDAKSKIDIAFKAGMEIAERAKARGIKRVVFDRNGYLYHGRVKAVAEGARKAGLEF